MLSSFIESRREPLEFIPLHFREEEEEIASLRKAVPKDVLLPFSFIGSMRRRHSFGGFVQYQVSEALQAIDDVTGKPLEQKMLDSLKSAASQKMQSYTSKDVVPAEVSVQSKRPAFPTSASAALLAVADKAVAAQSAGLKKDGEITTLMIKNLPKDLSQPSLISYLNFYGFEGRFNFCYLPSNFNTGSLGYAFINFVRGKDADVFRNQWHEQDIFQWQYQRPSIHNAVVQGIEANLRKFDHKKMKRIKNPALRPWAATESLKQGLQIQ
eukprot:TRINITY_DN15453_c0_g1_i1.p1 TRINITY_DN15453_c0_g1~~TRINITY_DN15453_c0_g1_i1.p1  ORF type:complete len:268 (+),score=56.79 TRINITY_DN15453_c0_g1_i1:154-957(+)